MEMSNDVCFSGTVVTFNPMSRDDGMFGGSMTIKGMSKRPNSRIMKECLVGFIVPKNIWSKLLLDNVNVGSELELCAHFESWIQTKESDVDGRLHDKTKLVHIVDQVISTNQLCG